MNRFKSPCCHSSITITKVREKREIVLPTCVDAQETDVFRYVELPEDWGVCNDCLTPGTPYLT